VRAGPRAPRRGRLLRQPLDGRGGGHARAGAPHRGALPRDIAGLPGAHGGEVGWGLLTLSRTSTYSRLTSLLLVSLSLLYTCC
jgi:hypothetical protein